MFPANLVSYHMHSSRSDGTHTITEMVRAAEAAGLGEVGLSDHYVLPPPSFTRSLDWALDCDELQAYATDVLNARASAGLPVRLGLEVDYFPETRESLPERLAGVDFDYLIGSVHIVDNFPIDFSADFWLPLDREGVNAMHRLYWQRLREMIRTGFFDIVGHLDLPKKFGFFPTADLSGEIGATLDALAAADMAMELNTAGWDKICAEPYPPEPVLRMAFERGIPVLVSADAHAPEEVARHYARAKEILGRTGYRETVRFENRNRHAVPL